MRKKRRKERGAKDRAEKRKGSKVSISNPNSSENDDDDHDDDDVDGDGSEKEEGERLEEEEEEELERSWAFSAAQEGALSDSDQNSPEDDGVQEDDIEEELRRNVPFLTSVSTSISPKRRGAERKVLSPKAPIRINNEGRKRAILRTESPFQHHVDEDPYIAEELSRMQKSATKKSTGIYIELSD